jgi:inhibitor of KinA sporulation pathway (predicted exonuclease)
LQHIFQRLWDFRKVRQFARIVGFCGALRAIDSTLFDGQHLKALDHEAENLKRLFRYQVAHQ